MSARLSPSHLLFDLDGTLLDSHDLRVRLEFIFRAVSLAAREIGLLRAIRGLRAVRLAVEIQDGRRTNLERAVDAFARDSGMAPTDARQLLLATIGSVFPRLERHFFPVPGAREFVAWSSGRYPATLATNPVWPLEQVLLRLSWSGIPASAFERITHSGIMLACKPTPEYYRAVVQETGLEPSRLLLIGNDERKDLPATRVGIPVFILGPEESAAELSAPGAPAWRGTFSALRRLLENGEAR